MKKLWMLLLFGFPFVLSAQNVGIGTSNPVARLHVEQGNVLLKGPSSLPAVVEPSPGFGSGARLMWYGDKAALRAGYAIGASWDQDSIGQYSVVLGYNSRATGSTALAMGSNSRATGSVSTAFGIGCTANGIGSTAFGRTCTANGGSSTAFGEASTADGYRSIAMGHNCTASGESSTAFGDNSKASGLYSTAFGRFSSSIGAAATAFGFFCFASGVTSTAFGNNCTATGPVATAFGYNCTASGESATAFGRSNIANGDSSTAIGNNCTSSGRGSVAMGNYVSTSGYAGAFALGDASSTVVMQSFVANGFRARFAGGYRLFTNNAVSIGAFLNANANSWAALSDVRMKENFLPVDGEAFLKKIAAMPQVSWNYIGQDAKTLRHYGPMAQDFYKAFGRDDLGEIGCDTLINQQDFLGVNLIAIQALEKRTHQLAEQQKEIMQLKAQNETLLAAFEKLSQQVKDLMRLKNDESISLK